MVTYNKCFSVQASVTTHSLSIVERAKNEAEVSVLLPYYYLQVSRSVSVTTHRRPH